MNTMPNANDSMCHFKRFSWTAVIVGALVGIGISFLLNLFSVAIGLSIVATNKEGMISLAVGGFLGLLIGTIVSTFMAGLTAGYLGKSYSPKRNLGVLYGFTAWCLALILMALLAASIGRYVTAYASFVTQTQPTTVVVTDSAPTAVAVDQKANGTTMTIEQQKATNTLGYSAFIIFILFFIGAVSSCFGGHYGMSCKEESCTYT